MISEDQKDEAELDLLRLFAYCYPYQQEGTDFFASHQNFSMLSVIWKLQEAALHAAADPAIQADPVQGVGDIALPSPAVVRENPA